MVFTFFELRDYPNGFSMISGIYGPPVAVGKGQSEFNEDGPFLLKIWFVPILNNLVCSNFTNFSKISGYFDSILINSNFK